MLLLYCCLVPLPVTMCMLPASMCTAHSQHVSCLYIHRTDQQRPGLCIYKDSRLPSSN